MTALFGLVLLVAVALALYYARLHLEWRAVVRRRRAEREREREQAGYGRRTYALTIEPNLMTDADIRNLRP